MFRIAAFLALAVSSALPAFAQPGLSDSQTLQAILAELRSAHNDQRLGQTSQILLAEMLVQQTAVDRATQRRDDLRTKLTQVQSSEKSLTLQLTQYDDQLAKTIDPAQIKRFTDIQNQVKAAMVSQAQQEKDWTNDLAEAEGTLRKQQDDLQGIQDQLSGVIRKLQPASGQ